MRPRKQFIMYVESQLLICMSLKEYHRKRDFNVTSEPKGDHVSKRKKLIYVIQKHQASRLHYDFRLEWNGVLLSWAVPKGPSLDPSVKRLAMRVEDHPIDYVSFEGVIPEGQYGGGTVMVWDRGTWKPEVPGVEEALERGDLKFTLEGRKLKGSWVLVRTPRGWLLIKHRDEYASREDILTAEPRSAVSNQLLREIALENHGDVEKAAKADPVSA
jgi:bifunctional non-homologous end joining protein LigD